MNKTLVNKILGKSMNHTRTKAAYFYDEVGVLILEFLLFNTCLADCF